jgi:ABC-type dipeptide/oligopeptide/nickel transport system permease component
MLSESRGGRAFQYLFVLVVAISLNFFLPRMMPGNPLALLAGVDPGLMSPEGRAELMAEAGLDRSLPEQYISYWGDLLQGDFGYSYRQKEPIGRGIVGHRRPGRHRRRGLFSLETRQHARRWSIMVDDHH